MSLVAECFVFVRFILAWLWTLAFSLVACLTALLVGPTRAWVLCRTVWARVTLWLVGVKLVVTGTENLGVAGLYIANHESLIDDVLLPAVLPPTTRFVAKRELLYVPLWGWILAMGGALLVDRKNPRRARRSLKKGIGRLPKGWSLVVFPEGTRSRTGELGPFKSGAFHLALKAGMPVVPIGIHGARAIVAADGWIVRGGVVRVHFGAPLPIESSGETDLRQAHIEQARAAVIAAMRIAKESDLS